MAGHSKWANIKHKKEKEDARRGRLFTKLARQITVAAREGGGDPESNFRFRVAIDNARAQNMPNENIERAIKRGTGELDGGTYEEFIYEGYGPGGVAILLEVMTDNRNRTASDVRHLFSRNGGNLGESGCVNWMFEAKGIIVIDASAEEEESLTLEAIEAGADDVSFEDNRLHIFTSPENLRSLREHMQSLGRTILESSIVQEPSTTVEVDSSQAPGLVALLEALEDHDDIQQVYTNRGVTDDALAKLES